METTKNYNGVTIKKTWSFIAFAKEFGRPRFAKCANHETGECFNAVAFDNGKDLTFCHFGYSTQGMSAKDIAREAQNLKVGLTTSDKYTLFKQSGDAWEEIDF